MWAVASAADSVMVMMKSVRANPSRTSTKTLPRQRGSSSSSMAMLPWPWRAARGDLLVDGQRHEQRDHHQHQRGHGRQEPRGQEGDAGLVAERGEVVHAGQAHHLPPGVGGVGMGRMLVGRRAAGEKPPREPSLVVGMGGCRGRVRFRLRTCRRGHAAQILRQGSKPPTAGGRDRGVSGRQPTQWQRTQRVRTRQGPRGLESASSYGIFMPGPSLLTPI